MSDINVILKKRRRELNMTMFDVAKRVGVSEGTISRWESGDIENMRRDKIVSLANALQISPSVIMGLTDESDEIIHTKVNYSKNDYTIDEKYLVNTYRKLNKAGKEKTTEYVSDLAGNDKYTAPGDAESKLNA